MRYLAIYKKKTLRSSQDDRVSQITQKAFIQEEEPTLRIREYSSFIGWFLSLFNISFKALDSHGKDIWLNRRQFCEHFVKIKKDIQQDIDLIFQREVSEMSYSHPDGNIDLMALYDAMSQELSKGA